MRIALVTYQDEGNYPGEGAKEDKLLLQYLQGKQLNINYEIWTDAHVKWEQYDLAILKSPWDYFDKIDAFLNWLQLMEDKNINLLNPIPVVRWTTDKHYLLEIENAGFAIVPTQIIGPEQHTNLLPYFEQWHTNKIIIKPRVSGGAKNTLFIRKSEIGSVEKKVKEMLAVESYLVQPFMPEIQTGGEWSLIYLNNQFSHSILKVPKRGEFRVQHYFGGSIVSAKPPAFVLEYTKELVQKFASGCLYARVDGLVSNGEFKLMELELVEPMLYLQENELLYENYYQALVQLLPELDGRKDKNQE